MEVERPQLPTELLSGWQETEATVDQPFDARVVSVYTHTVVFEDGDLARRLRETAGVDGQWRFVVAARLTLRPQTGPSRPLTRLVADRAHANFADRLRERGLEHVRERGTTRREVAGTTARVGRFEAVYDPGPVSVRTTAEVAVRPTEEAYLLAGGAYPTALRDSTDSETATAVTAALDSDRFESELAEFVAAVE
ncbi:MAG: DUF6517 family protein [Halobaculum sp.]|jgi:hypothetical protein